MKFFLFLVIFNILGVKPLMTSFVKPFLHANINHVVLCNEESSDDIFEDILDSIGEKDIWINHWNCSRDEIPFVHKGLIILNNVKPKVFKAILKLQGIQKSLSSNLWIVKVPSTVQDLTEYFTESKLKLGLNVQLFFVKSVAELNSVVQALGLGDFQPKFEVRQVLVLNTFLNILPFIIQDKGPIANLDPIEDIIKKVNERDNFIGIPFTVNFAERAIPYCYKNKEGEIEGIFNDAIKIVAEHLNLTLVYQETRPENKNIYSVK